MADIRLPVGEAKLEALIKRMADCGLREEDIKEHFVRSGGPGGQKVNKTSTCAVITHKPTGTEVKCSKTRSQGLNRYYARKIMCEMLENAALGRQSPAAIEQEKIRKRKRRRKSHTEKENVKKKFISS